MEILKTRRIPGLAELYLARLGPDPRRMIEFVDTLQPGVPKQRKWVLMISTQVGCAVGCALCDAGAVGYRGNLTAEEMLDQVRHCLAANPTLDAAGHPKLKVHFARMGEPTLNPAVLEALQRLPEAVGNRRVVASLSTVAPDAPACARFLEELRTVKDRFYPGGRFQLQFSLHATDDASRRKVVPIRAWGLARIGEYGRRFRRPGDRKITLNFAPPPDARLDPEGMPSLFSPEDFLIKITPVNPTGAADETGNTHVWTDPPAAVARFAARLEELGFEVIVSPSTSEEIEGATSCGQLWSEGVREQADARRRNRRRERRVYVRPGTLAEKAALWRGELLPYVRDVPRAPAEPALLVVDMQEFFLSPRSAAYLPAARAVAGNVVRLARAFREAGRPVGFTVHAYEDPAREAGRMASWWRKTCLASSPEARVIAALDRRPGEPVFRKTRYSGFSNPELAPWLARAGAKSLVVCGVMTNLCVESTARDAFGLDFDVRIPLDGCAASDETLHVGALRNAAYGFATIHSTEELLSDLCLKSC